MKHLIIAIMDNHKISEDVLIHLSTAGYNGSVIMSTSLKHSLSNSDEIPLFLNLTHLHDENLENNTTLNIVVDEDQIDDVFNIIRTYTDNFNKCKGAMFALPLSRFEGKF